MANAGMIIQVLVKWGPRAWDAIQVLDKFAKSNPDLRDRLQRVADGRRKALKSRSRSERIRRTIDSVREPIERFAQSTDPAQLALGRKWERQASTIATGVDLASGRRGKERRDLLAKLEDRATALLDEVFEQMLAGFDTADPAAVDELAQAVGDEAQEVGVTKAVSIDGDVPPPTAEPDH